MTESHEKKTSRRAFLAGSGVGLVAGAAATHLLTAEGPAAPAIISPNEVGTEWKIQTSWPGGRGLDVFKEWANSVVEKTSGELKLVPYKANELVGEFQLFDAVSEGKLQAINSFTQYWSGRMPACVFLVSFPLGLRQAQEWEVFYYKLGGLEIARELFARFGMYYLGPIRHGANIIHSKKPIRSIADFKGLRMRMPGGLVAELFQAAGALTVMLPGSEILQALKADSIDAADYVGPAVNVALGLHKEARFVSMGPAGFMSIYQPVDLMDMVVSAESWRKLPERMKRFLEDEVRIYSLHHHTEIEAADQEAWLQLERDGAQITRLGDEDVDAFTRLIIPRWFAWANRDRDAGRLFRIHLDYMMSGSLGYITPDMIKGQRLNA